MMKSQFNYLIFMRGSILLLLSVLMLLPSSWLASGTAQPMGSLLVAFGWLSLPAMFSLRQRGAEPTQGRLFAQLLFDLLLLAAWLWFSGGASNAFVSLLLLPIALAAICLPARPLAALAIIALLAYSLLLTQLSNHPHAQHQMQSHFVGMWVTFLISVVLLVLVVARLAARLKLQDMALLKLREEQLRAEQILTLGTAATQVVHQFATPLNTLQLIAEMLRESHPDEPLLDELQRPLQRCTEHLAQFRDTARQMQANTPGSITLAQLLTILAEQARLAMPEAKLQLQQPLPQVCLKSDPALIPALLNLLNNALLATPADTAKGVIISAATATGGINISIRDFGPGIETARLQELGQRPVPSHHGFGVAILLSHATLERLGGQLAITNHPDGGTEACVTLPLEDVDGNENSDNNGPADAQR